MDLQNIYVVLADIKCDYQWQSGSTDIKTVFWFDDFGLTNNVKSG